MHLNNFTRYWGSIDMYIMEVHKDTGRISPYMNYFTISRRYDLITGPTGCSFRVPEEPYKKQIQYKYKGRFLCQQFRVQEKSCNCQDHGYYKKPAYQCISIPGENS